MKLSDRKKTGRWDRWGFYQGRYKNFVIKIVEGGEPFSQKREYYWVSFQSNKYHKGFNSLWENKKFNTVDEAKEWSIQWVDDCLKEN